MYNGLAPILVVFSVMSFFSPFWGLVNIKRLGRVFDDSFLVIGKNFK
jgi:hypothetical protein